MTRMYELNDAELDAVAAGAGAGAAAGGLVALAAAVAVDATNVLNISTFKSSTTTRSTFSMMPSMGTRPMLERACSSTCSAVHQPSSAAWPDRSRSRH